MQKRLLTPRQFFYTSYVETKSEGKYVWTWLNIKICLFPKDSMKKKHLLVQKRPPKKLHFQKNLEFLVFSQSWSIK